MSATPHFATLADSDERFLTYTLFEILPPNHFLIADTELLMITKVDDSGHIPVFLESQHFTYDEFGLIITILADYSPYCPLANLLQATKGGTLEEHQRALIEADAEGWMTQLMRPMRNTLSRARLKMKRFDISITSLIGLGYTLTSYSARTSKSRR